MMQGILIVGGYGEVGRRIARLLEVAHPGSVVVAGRNPERATGGPARRIDVDDPASIDAALPGIDVVVACVRQREPHLLHAAVRRGIAYTSIAPPWMPWPELEPLHAEARRTGARIVAATGLEPGISSVLARVAAERLGTVDAIETALLLGVGDAYGADSMVFLLAELAERYDVLVDGRSRTARAFGESKRVVFPDPIGERLAYTIPFRDQLYYLRTLGARTSIARIALEPAWLGRAVAMIARLGGRALTRRSGPRAAMHRWTEALRRRYADTDRFALVVEVRRGNRVVRAKLIGRKQAHATAVGAAAIAQALFTREVDAPGIWLAEQVIDPDRFLARLAAEGLVPAIQGPTPIEQPVAASKLEQASSP
jgi:saccharopine dehydrogenase-like NADP-dependent oxidoreductase